MPSLSPRLSQALADAAYAHRNQLRKGSAVPYIAHPMAVMYLCSRYTNDEDVLIAALLHDVLEDVPEELPATTIATRYGQRVLALIQSLSKDKTLPTWQERANAYLDTLAHLDPELRKEALLICAADKYHNLSSTLDDLRRDGEVVWQRFRSTPWQQHWWYTSVYELTKPLIATRLSAEYAQLLTEFQGFIPEQE